MGDSEIGCFRYKETAQQDMDSSSELVEELSRQADLARMHPVRQGSIADQVRYEEEIRGKMESFSFRSLRKNYFE